MDTEKELTMRDLLLLILKKQEEIEARLEKVEAVAHPQSVMADPALTELIKRLFEQKDDEEIPHRIDDVIDRNSPYVPPTTTPISPIWPNPNDRTTSPWKLGWPTITVC